MNWTCNCSLYNTLVLVVYIMLLSERGSKRWSRGVRQHERWMEYAETFGNANAGWNMREQTVFWSNLNYKFEIFLTEKCTIGAVLD